jgi:hypothetical protein
MDLLLLEHLLEQDWQLLLVLLDLTSILMMDRLFVRQFVLL